MAGNINPNLQLGLNQQASFNVVNPVEAAQTVTNQNTQEEIGRQRNFQAGINNAIAQAAANMRNKQSEEAAMARQLEANQAAEEQLRLREQLELQNALTLAQQKQKADAADISSYLDVGSKLADAVSEGNLTPQMATQMQNQELLRRLALNPQSEQLRNAARTTFGQAGAPLSEVELDNIIAGDTSFLESANIQAVESQLKLKRDQAVAEAVDAQNKAMSSGLKVKQAKDIIEAPDRIASFGESIATNEAEANVFRDIAEDMRLSTSDPEGAKAYAKDRVEYLQPGGRDLVLTTIAVGEDMQNTLRKVEAAGATIRGFSTAGVQAITAKLLGGDGEGALAIVNKQLEDGFIEDQGSLSDEEVKELSSKLFADYKKLLGPYTAINRNVFKNVGTQTEGDFDRGIGFFFPLGGSLTAALDNLENAIGTFEGITIKSDLYYGKERPAEALFNDFKAKGYTFDDRGIVVKEDIPTMAEDFGTNFVQTGSANIMPANYADSNSMNVQFGADGMTIPEANPIDTQSLSPAGMSLFNKLQQFQSGGF